jgi:hypothetical protein
MLNVNKREEWGGEISNFTIIEKKKFLPSVVHLNNFWFLEIFTKLLKDPGILCHGGLRLE